jgi:hypothetical protein
LRLEVKRGDRFVKSKDISLPRGQKFPVHFNEKISMISTFYIDEQKKSQEKNMVLYLYGEKEKISEAIFDIAPVYGKKE